MFKSTDCPYCNGACIDCYGGPCLYCHGSGEVCEKCGDIEVYCKGECKFALEMEEKEPYQYYYGLWF